MNEIYKPTWNDIIEWDFANKLHCGDQRNLPVWYVSPDTEKPIRKILIRLRGHCDNYHTSKDYCDFADNSTGTSSRIFPIKGYKKPELRKIVDDWGEVSRWIASPKMTGKRKAE